MEEVSIVGLGSINDYAGLLQNYKVPVIPSISVDRVREQEHLQPGVQDTDTLAEAAGTSSEASRLRDADRVDAALEDISLTFNKQNDFGYIGRDKDIRQLDVEKAVGDMRKDKILHQYQYFVGSRDSALAKPDNSRIF